MRKNKNIWLWLFFGILIVILAVIYYLSQVESIKNCQDDLQKKRDNLKNRISTKEDFISYLTIEIGKLKVLDYQLIQQAIKFYRWLKFMVLLIILGIGFVCYAIFELDFSSSIAIVLGVSAFIFNSFTILFLNRVGDFNLTLKILQDLFIAREYRKHNFEPALIQTFEARLHVERQELIQLKLEYNNLTDNKSVN